MVLGGHLGELGDKGQDPNGDQCRNSKDEKLRWGVIGQGRQVLHVAPENLVQGIRAEGGPGSSFTVMD